MDEAAHYMSGLYGSLGLGFPSRFEQNYRCYSASFIDKAHLELGDKVIMPPSALDRLASLRIDYPMLFEMHNPAISRTTHCGVLEFVAEEGMIYMPYWMMQNLLLQEGEIVRVKSAALPKGTYVKLQPHTTDFLDISNPKAVLETALRNFSCLTVGDNIMVAYNNKKYYIDIVEAKPAMAISIIETDCEVDFAPPLDYKEPERVLPQVPVSLPAVEGAHAVEQKEVSFSAFTGSGRRLDGKPARQSPTQENILQKASVSSAAPSLSSSTTSAVTSAPQKRSGKLVFGASPSNVSTKPIEKEVVAKDEVKEKEPPKFQAFTGKKYSLKDYNNS